MTNDERILNSRERIKRETELIAKAEKEIGCPKTNLLLPTTSLLLTYPGKGEPINLHTKSIEQLREIAINLNMYKLSYEELKKTMPYTFAEGEEPSLASHPISDWLEDIEFVAKKKNLAKRKADLRAANSKLTNLLSTDKQTELEIDNIVKGLALLE